MSDLHSKVIRTAASLSPDDPARVALMQVLAASQPSYQDYVQTKRKQKKEPLSREDWEEKVLGKKPAPSGSKKEDEKEDEKEDDKKKSGPSIASTALVFPMAKVTGNAQISGKAKLFDKSKASGDVQMTDDSYLMDRGEITDRVKLSGEASVTEDAKAFGDAQMTDRSQLQDEAQITDRVKMSGKAILYGKARASGDAVLKGKALIGGTAVILGGTWDGSEGRITEGTWLSPDVRVPDDWKGDPRDYNPSAKGDKKKAPKPESEKDQAAKKSPSAKPKSDAGDKDKGNVRDEKKAPPKKVEKDKEPSSKKPNKKASMLRRIAAMSPNDPDRAMLINALLEGDMESLTAPGNILVSSWGYDQTNADFYEIVGRTSSMVLIREIDKKVVSQTETSARVVPVPGKFIGPVMKKKPTPGFRPNTIRVNINSYSGASTWDGKPQLQDTVGR